MKHLLFLVITAFLAAWSVRTYAQEVTSVPLDTLGKKVVTDIVIEGNKLTKDHIILREMTIAVGDSLYWGNLKAGIEQSHNNVMNLSLFNFVKIKPIQTDNEQVILLISVQERWYIYPLPILEIAQTNFNTWWADDKKFKWLNYGAYISHQNFRGRNEKIKLTARFGYTKKFSASYSIPNLNKKQTLSLYTSAGYFENDEIAYNTFDNERQYYDNSKEKALRYYQYQVGLGYRENIFLKHYFEVSFVSATVNDSVPILQPDYFLGGKSHTEFFRTTYSIDYDTRDYKRYPLNGVLVYATLQQSGLGIVNKEGLNLFTSQAGYNHHHKLADRFYFGHSLSGKVNWSNPPYYLTEGLGYNNLVRGYEYYIIDGTRWALFKSNFKYEILKPKSITIPFVPSKKFNKTFIALYGNAFFDSGYVSGESFEANNSLVNRYIYSFGLGLDLVTYYDKVVRMEGSLNGEGQFGFYLEFKQSF